MPRALSVEQLAATGEFIARGQGEDGDLPWFPGGQWDAWNHTEALMGLTVAGIALRGVAEGAAGGDTGIRAGEGKASRSVSDGRWGSSGAHPVVPGNATVNASALPEVSERLLTAARAGLEHLARTQRRDGSWPMQVQDGVVVHAESDTNQCAYPAVGVWHYVLATGDDAAGARFWPMVRAALDHVLLAQRDDGTIAWAINERGGLGDHALLTGNASILQSLWAGAALADLFERGSSGKDDGGRAGRTGAAQAGRDAHAPRRAESDTVAGPTAETERTERTGAAQAGRDAHASRRAAAWRDAGRRLAAAVRRPELFADRARYSMDWFYPVLGGAFVGDAAHAQLERSWQRFVWAGQGVRCVDDRPWVTGGESAELVMALTCLDGTRHEAAARERARSVFADIQRLRDDDGGYWTGYVVDDDAIWPEEKTGWTAGAVLLAADALDGLTPAANLFHAMTWPEAPEAAPTSTDSPLPRSTQETR